MNLTTILNVCSRNPFHHKSDHINKVGYCWIWVKWNKVFQYKVKLRKDGINSAKENCVMI